MKQLTAIILAFTLSLTLWACGTDDPAENSTGRSDQALTGWQTINGERYCFTEDGIPITGWLSDISGSGGRYYLNDSGMALTGWQEIDGKRYYFGTDGVMTTGWAELDGSSYYFGIDGVLFTGLLNIQGKGYYFDENGRRHSGWLEQDGKTYYFGSDGVMAVGPAEIDGKIHYFSPHGIKILLVNPWNTVPEGYEVELVNVSQKDQLEKACAEALTQMLSDCRAAGYNPYIVSAYRTQEEQEYLFERKVKSFLAMNWTREAAEKETAKEIAVPGTSEHQLGLAVDIIDSNYGYLDDHQANMPTQKWLMEHCHEYGFILRYPVGSTEITGIIFEPWHYRYVGVEIAQEIMNLGITLEEYLGAVS